MKDTNKEMFLIRLAYWLGIFADGLWSIALFSPAVFGFLTGNPDYNPTLEVKLLMGLGGTLMTCWTLLLIWAVRNPIERRFVILLTALVVFGLTIITIIRVINGDQFSSWILIKTAILMISMITSYILANKMSKSVNTN